MLECKFVSGPCGSAKTTITINHAIKRVEQGAKYLVIQPTIELLKQTANNIKHANNKLAVFSFHSELQDNVGEAIQRHFDKKLDEPQFILCTEATMINSKDWPNTGKVYVIWDELPNPALCQTYNLPDNFQFITDTILLEHDIGQYLKIFPRDTQRLNSYKTSNDDINNVLKSMAEILTNPNYDNYGHKIQWTTNAISQLSIFSILKPDFLKKFKSVTFLSACFEQSLLYLIWKNMGVDFVPNREIMNSLFFSKNQLFDRSVTFHYFTSTVIWSKNIQEKIDSIELKNAIQQIMRDDQYIYCANKSIKDFLSGLRISSSIRGLNHYQHYHKGIFLSALNDKPDQYKFLESKFGISASQLSIANMCQAAYQFVYRTSLRNQYSIDAVDIIVPTLQIAEFLASQCEGTNIKIKKIEHNIKILNCEPNLAGRPKNEKPSKKALQARARREKQKGAK